MKGDKEAVERMQKIRFWSAYSDGSDKHNNQQEIGYNYCMSEASAGIGRGQLKVLDERVSQKQYIYHWYKKELGEMADIEVMPVGDNVSSNCWLTAIQVKDSSKVSAMDIIKVLEADDIESRPVWKPMHLQPVFQKYDFISADEDERILSKTEFMIVNEELGANNSIGGNLFSRGVCLPSDTKMDDQDLHRICAVIRALFV